MAATAPFNVTVCGIDELTVHCEARVSHVISILDPDWPVPTAFGAYGEHQRLELRFDDVIENISGKTPPGPEDIHHLLAFGRQLMSEPEVCRHLLIHCGAGFPYRRRRWP